MEVVTLGRLLELFSNKENLEKLNKDNFIAKEPVYSHDKDSKGHTIHFSFETPNFENFFTIIVRLNSFEGYGNDDIKLCLLAGYLSRVKEGSILYSSTGICEFKIIKASCKDLYNLLDVNSNRLLFLECKRLDYIQNRVNEGVFHAK